MFIIHQDNIYIDFLWDTQPLGLPLSQQAETGISFGTHSRLDCVSLGKLRLYLPRTRTSRGKKAAEGEMQQLVYLHCEINNLLKKVIGKNPDPFGLQIVKLSLVYYKWVEGILE